MTERRSLDWDAYPLDRSHLSSRSPDPGAQYYDTRITCHLSRSELKTVADTLRSLGFDIHPSQSKEEPVNATSTAEQFAAEFRRAVGL